MRIVYLATLLLLICFSSPAQSFIQGPYLNKFIGLPLVADFNGDGKVDVAGSAHFFSYEGDITLYKNVSDSNSIIFESIKLGWTGLGDPGFGDFDGDEDMDLVVTQSEDTTVLILLNNGNGTFVSHLQEAGIAYGFRTADMDGDDDIDIVGFSEIDFSAFLMINDGFGQFTSMPLIEDETDLYALEIGDLDGDEDFDIVVGTQSFFDGKILELENKGNNIFERKTLKDPAILNLENIQIIDIDRDSDNDIAYSSFSSSQVLAMINKSNHVYTDANLAKGTGTIRSFRIADYNTDGIMDMILGCNSSSATYNQGLSASSFEYSSEPITEIQPMFYIANGDFDGDDDLDLIASNGEFWWLRNELEQGHVSVTGIDETLYSIYPNPFSDYLELNMIPESLDIYITDLSGRIVWQSRGASSLHNLGLLKEGSYFFTIVDRKARRMVKTSKIIKI
jgi:hypothetical protein